MNTRLASRIKNIRTRLNTCREKNNDLTNTYYITNLEEINYFLNKGKIETNLIHGDIRSILEESELNVKKCIYPLRVVQEKLPIELQNDYYPSTNEKAKSELLYQMHENHILIGLQIYNTDFLAKIDSKNLISKPLSLVSITNFYTKNDILKKNLEEIFSITF